MTPSHKVHSGGFLVAERKNYLAKISNGSPHDAQDAFKDHWKVHNQEKNIFNYL